MTLKHALVCSYHTPQPDRDSGARRVFHFIQFLLDAGWSVTFLAADGIGHAADASRLRRMGVSVREGDAAALAEWLRGNPIHLALFAFWPTADRYLPAVREVCPRARILVDSIDLHFVRESREAFARGTLAAPAALDAGFGTRAAKELSAYAAADAVLAVSDKESQLIADVVGQAGLTFTVADGEEIPANPLPFDQRRGIVWIGSFQHKPNVSSLEFLCQRVLPLVDPQVLREHPVYVIGNGMTPAIRAMGRGLAHVKMVGWVPKVEPYLQHGQISVVPLLYGAGTKRKLIQALMHGTPTVSTTVGVEGLHLTHEQHVLIADEPADFARQIERLLCDQPLWNRLAEQGRTHIAQRHDLRRARSRLLETIETVLSREPKGRPQSAVVEVKSTAVRLTSTEYSDLTKRVQAVVSQAVPPRSTLAVINKGDASLLDLGERRGLHFPQLPDGSYAGHYPANGRDALRQLQDVRQRGASHLVIPTTAQWWLEFYPELRKYLDEHCRVVGAEPSVCTVYALNGDAALAQAVAGPTIEVRERQPYRRPIWDGQSPRVIAFYLPQFHPIAENNAWWGEGFTEWRNVAKADPLFAGHYQPHIPRDLGFYDLRCAETRQEQAHLAAEHGVFGFCYYHYWFGGKRLLERPFNEVLQSGQPDFPFCLAWANDPWSRRWDGREKELLQPQIYSPQDDVNHIRSLLPALGDARAITVNGKPVFMVYRAKSLPDPQRTTDLWREEVAKAGLKGIYLIAMETAWDFGWDATAVGFDAKVLFQPQFAKLMTDAERIIVPEQKELQVYDYARAWRFLSNLPGAPYRRFETVFPGWDNTARVGGRAVVMHDSTPGEYGQWLSQTLDRAMDLPAGERLVFVNAWNEWAEGAHLEPDQKHGLAYLQATRAATERSMLVRSSQ